MNFLSPFQYYMNDQNIINLTKSVGFPKMFVGYMKSNDDIIKQFFKAISEKKTLNNQFLNTVKEHFDNNVELINIDPVLHQQICEILEQYSQKSLPSTTPQIEESALTSKWDDIPNMDDEIDKIVFQNKIQPDVAVRNDLISIGFKDVEISRQTDKPPSGWSYAFVSDNGNITYIGFTKGLFKDPQTMTHEEILKNYDVNEKVFVTEVDPTENYNVIIGFTPKSNIPSNSELPKKGLFG